MTQVSWLTSPQLALACRRFCAGRPSGIVDAPPTTTKIGGQRRRAPWAWPDRPERPAGPPLRPTPELSVTPPCQRRVIGALAPVLTPGEAGERRSFLVAYPILQQSAADRRTANSEWAADLGEEMRHKAKIKQRARSRAETAKARGVDAKLARGSALTRPYAVCTVTVPKTARIAEHGRRLDASVRRAGFAPLRLDLAHDVGVAASTVPLGVSLTRRGAA